jgi:hypothetical protein
MNGRLAADHHNVLYAMLLALTPPPPTECIRILFYYISAYTPAILRYFEVFLHVADFSRPQWQVPLSPKIDTTAWHAAGKLGLCHFRR